MFKYKSESSVKVVMYNHLLIMFNQLGEGTKSQYLQLSLFI